MDRTIDYYDYDHLYRLTAAQYSASHPVGDTSGEVYAYAYDPVGNRLQQIINGDTTSYQYDAANRLAQVAVSGQPAAVTYQFDANGNLLQTGAMTNTWDAANRLTAASFVYNGLGDRVGQTLGLTTTSFALDVQGLPEVIYTSEGNAYLQLPGVIMTESAEGETRYLLSDGLGSIRQVTDDTGSVVGYNEFDPYGNPSARSAVGGQPSPYGFTGEWWQSEVGLLHLRARWYAPETGSFLSRDAWEGDLSRPDTLHGYSYAANNPIIYRDASGLDYLPHIDRYTCDDPRAGSGYVYQYDKATGTWGLWPCIVDPNNMQHNGPFPIPPSIPTLPRPPVRPPKRTPGSSESCPVVPQTGRTQCQEFTQEVQQIIASSKAQGMTDGMTVMILAQYYSAIRIQTRDFELFGRHPLFPGNPALPGGYFRGQDQERYQIPIPPTRDEIAKYGFKKIFWNNTHHYFADFYHTYFLGDNISFVGAYGRETLQFATGANQIEETLADYAIHWVAKDHVHQVSSYSTMLGAYVAPVIPGRIEILPGLLRTDACEALSWVLPPKDQ